MEETNALASTNRLWGRDPRRAWIHAHCTPCRPTQAEDARAFCQPPERPERCSGRFDLLDALPGSIPFSTHLAKENARARLIRREMDRPDSSAQSRPRTCAPHASAPREPAPAPRICLDPASLPRHIRLALAAYLLAEPQRASRLDIFG